MISRDQVKDHLINKDVYFGRPILKKGTEIFSTVNMNNFLEIYSQLLGTFNKNQSYFSKTILDACDLLKNNSDQFWEDNNYYYYINKSFSIKINDLDKFIDLIIMPTINCE